MKEELQNVIQKIESEISTINGILASKLQKKSVQTDRTDVTPTWDFRSVGLNLGGGLNFYQSLLLTSDDKVVDGVNYEDFYWINQNNHQQGSYGSLFHLTNIPVKTFYYYNKSGSDFFVSRTSPDGTNGTDTNYGVGLFIYERDIEYDGVPTFKQLATHRFS